MKYVLFVCTRNAGRSQIAQAFFERDAPADIRADSKPPGPRLAASLPVGQKWQAPTRPTGCPNGEGLRRMRRALEADYVSKTATS
jgi:low molecular weight phosphotyrosine protein phosphatase